MNPDTQAIIAIAVVVLTFAAFIVAKAKGGKKSGGCGHGCGCDHKPSDQAKP